MRLHNEFEKNQFLFILADIYDIVNAHCKLSETLLHEHKHLEQIEHNTNGNHDQIKVISNGEKCSIGPCDVALRLLICHALVLIDFKSE